jgi:hypothetical protein
MVVEFCDIKLNINYGRCIQWLRFNLKIDIIIFTIISCYQMAMYSNFLVLLTIYGLLHDNLKLRNEHFLPKSYDAINELLG